MIIEFKFYLGDDTFWRGYVDEDGYITFCNRVIKKFIGDYKRLIKVEFSAAEKPEFKKVSVDYRGFVTSIGSADIYEPLSIGEYSLRRMVNAQINSNFCFYFKILEAE